MGLNKPKTQNKTYVSIYGSRIVKRIKQAEEGSTSRILSKGPNEGNEIHELEYESLDGQIIGGEIKGGEFGDQMILDFLTSSGDCVCLSLNAESNYGRDIMFKIPSMKISEQITINPYDFEDKESGKRRTGITIYQDGDKVPRFWTKDEPGKLPQAVQKKKGKGKEWDFSEQYNFLIEEFERAMSDISVPAPSENQSNSSARDQIVADSKAAEAMDDNDSSDLPF